MAKYVIIKNKIFQPLLNSPQNNYWIYNAFLGEILILLYRWSITHMTHSLLQEQKRKGCLPSSKSSIYYTFTTFVCLFMLVNVNLYKVSSEKKMPIKPVNTGYIDIYQFRKRIQFLTSFWSMSSYSKSRKSWIINRSTYWNSALSGKDWVYTSAGSAITCCFLFRDFKSRTGRSLRWGKEIWQRE